MKKIIVLLGIFLCMQYKAAMQEVIKAAEELKDFYAKVEQADGNSNQIYNTTIETLIKNLKPAWEEDRRNELKDETKYQLLIKLVNKFVEKNILQHSTWANLENYFEGEEKYVGQGYIKTCNLYFTHRNGKFEYGYKKPMWYLWALQDGFVEDLTFYAEQGNIPSGAMNLRENIKILAYFPDTSEQCDDDIKNYKNTFIEFLGKCYIKNILKEMKSGYSDVFTPKEQKNIFTPVINFLAKEYEQEKTSDMLKLYMQKLLIKTSRYLYGLDNTIDFDTLLTIIKNQEEKNAIIKQIKEGLITHIVRTNPKKAAAATAGIVAIILGALGHSGLRKLYEYYKGQN